MHVNLTQNWCGYSAPATEEAQCEVTILRHFAGLHLDRISDETTIFNFQRLLERHKLADITLKVIKPYLGERSLLLPWGSIVDTTIIHAPSSTKKKYGKPDPEMHQTKKGNLYYFGMEGTYRCR